MPYARLGRAARPGVGRRPNPMEGAAVTAFDIQPLHPDFGARIAGIDLATIDRAGELAALRAAIDRYSLLHFPGQELDDASQLALTRLLGQPEVEHVKFGRSGRVDYFGTVGNIGEDGDRRGNDHADVRFAAGNRMWHSDSSFRPIPAFVSITHAREVPDEGGETEFASCRVAWARLPDAMRERIAPLKVVHDYVFSRSKVAPVHPSHARSLPPVVQRLVRTNPATGARNYYVGSHAREVVGWGRAEGRALLDDLLARATRAQDIYRHRWRVGDVLIWDNRCLLHRGRGWDADRYRRHMRQTRVSCPCPTAEE